MNPASLALTPPKRDRLIACLRLAVRPGTVGEREAALNGAMRILHALNLDWNDVLIQSVSAPRPFSEDDHEEESDDLAVCTRAIDELTTWEQHFIRSLRRFRRLSPKQREILAGIAAKVRARGGAA